MPKYLLALFLALTGLMMVIAPVAVMAMSGTMLCDRQASLTIEHTTSLRLPGWTMPTMERTTV